MTQPEYEEIIGILPQSCRQNSLGAMYGVRRMAKEYDEMLTENHLFRHGHKVAALVRALKCCRANFVKLYKAGTEHGSSFGEEFSHDAEYCINLIDKALPIGPEKQPDNRAARAALTAQRKGAQQRAELKQARASADGPTRGAIATVAPELLVT